MGKMLENRRLFVQRNVWHLIFWSGSHKAQRERDQMSTILPFIELAANKINSSTSQVVSFKSCWRILTDIWHSANTATGCGSQTRIQIYIGHQVFFNFHLLTTSYFFIFIYFIYFQVFIGVLKFDIRQHGSHTEDTNLYWPPGIYRSLH